MKPYLKATLFLIILTLFDFLFRKGLVGHFIPFQLSSNYVILILFTVFAFLSWLITKWFCRRDNISTHHDLGISLNSKNRNEFFIGFLVGVILWGIVSIIQSVTAGFSWELRPNISVYNIFYGLIFIFIADLGTELYTRGYPLKRFEDSFGTRIAIVIMVFFVGLKSFTFAIGFELLFYVMIIPALHTIFFSIVYFKTRRLGAALGIHTGANFVTISIFDLRIEQPNQAIPSGLFQSNTDIETLSLTALQLPWVLVAVLFTIAVYYWWEKQKKPMHEHRL